MKVSEITFSGLNELPEVAEWVLKTAGKNKVLGFSGNLGAGKTTLIKEIVKKLGSDDTVQSPTFSLVNVYQSPEGIIYHIDAYRINQPEEALRIGLDEILYDKQYCLVEWFENISPLLPDEIIKFEIIAEENGIRKIRLI